MASFFELDSFLLDPTSLDDEPSSFLSFSSFSDLAPSSPFDFASWDYGFGSSKSKEQQQHHQSLQKAQQQSLSKSLKQPSSVPLSKTDSELSSSSTHSSPCDPFEVIESAFEPLAENAGIFHTPETDSFSRLSSASYSTIASSSSSSGGPSRHPSSSHSYRSSASSDSWDSPVTPGLSNKSSIESFASTSTIHPGSVHKLAPQPFSWDEASSGLGGGNVYVSPVAQQQVHRTTSNPTLSNASTRPRVPRPIASMPALKEEDPTATTPSAWFDGTEHYGEFSTTGLASTGSAAAQPLDTGDMSAASNLEMLDDVLVDDFDWVFAEYGLGVADASSDANLYAALQQRNEAQTVPSTSSSADNRFSDNQNNNHHSSGHIYDPPQTAHSSHSSHSQQSYQPLQQQQQEQSWLPTPAVQDTVSFGDYDYSSIANLPSFTIDPMSIMEPNGLSEVDEPSRPSSAPGNNGGEGYSGMLGVPLPGSMMRSVSSDGSFPQRHTTAAPRDLFSYAPQQIPTGPPPIQPLYTTEPSPSYNNMYPRSMPLTPSQTRRASVQGLSIQIQQPMYSTYNPGPTLPPTPQSAFGDMGSFQQQQQQHKPHHPPQPVQMTRAGTQPLPQTRRLSGCEPMTTKHKMPAHLARAQAIVQAQEAKEEAARQEYRRQAAARRVPMSQASVMQPHSYARPAQTITGWEGPSAQTASLPVLTTTPLVNIHPPPPAYRINPPPPPSHRVHPPPDTRSAESVSAAPSRTIARMPTSPAKRKVSASPVKRSPAAKKRSQAMQPGGFSWGETFINFTADDAEKLLTGVAPSGSQGKRKREEEAAAAAKTSLDGGMMGGLEMDRERSKRSRSGE